VITCFWVTPAYGVGYTKSYVAPYALVVSVLKRVNMAD
jgi:hypothetical protein